MQLNGQTFLIIDHIPTITRRFVMSLSQKDLKLVAVSHHTRHLLKMMYDHLIDDYSYCDFNNELKNYLACYHNISRVYIFASFYNSLNPALQAHIQSIHNCIYLVSVDEYESLFQSTLLGSQTKHTTLLDPLQELGKIFNYQPAALSYK